MEQECSSPYSQDEPLDSYTVMPQDVFTPTSRPRIHKSQAPGRRGD